MFGLYNDLLSIKELQKALGIGRSMAYRLIKDGDIRCFRIGKSIKVPKQYVMDFVRKSCYTEPVVADLPSEGGKI